MGIYQLGDRVPQIDPSAYVFDTATLIGTVILGARVSIWPYATLRGDNAPIAGLLVSRRRKSCFFFHSKSPTGAYSSVAQFIVPPS